jgi:hypothetical protein
MSTDRAPRPSAVAIQVDDLEVRDHPPQTTPRSIVRNQDTSLGDEGARDDQRIGHRQVGDGANPGRLASHVGVDRNDAQAIKVLEEPLDGRYSGGAVTERPYQYFGDRDGRE